MEKKKRRNWLYPNNLINGDKKPKVYHLNIDLYTWPSGTVPNVQFHICMTVFHLQCCISTNLYKVSWRLNGKAKSCLIQWQSNLTETRGLSGLYTLKHVCVRKFLKNNYYSLITILRMKVIDNFSMINYSEQRSDLTLHMNNAVAQVV